MIHNFDILLLLTTVRNNKQSSTLPLPGIKSWPLSLQSSALASQPRIPMTCHTVATFYCTRPTSTFILSYFAMYQVIQSWICSSFLFLFFFFSHEKIMGESSTKHSSLALFFFSFFLVAIISNALVPLFRSKISPQWHIELRRL